MAMVGKEIKYSFYMIVFICVDKKNREQKCELPTALIKLRKTA